MSYIYQIYVNSSLENVAKRVNRKRLGRAHLVYGMGEEILELSRRSRLKLWEEKEIFSTPGVVNVMEI